MSAAASDAIARCSAVGVTFGRGRSAVQALRDVDLTVRAGERLALRGRSGSGKTTLLHVLGGLVAPTSGSVEWDGRALSTLDAAARGQARASGIGYVFQGANLLPHFTAFENVAFARHASQQADHGDGHGPLELLALVGLQAKADSLPSQLSGGEGQRVAIARALAQRPRMLLCDEPTGHLDSDTGERVLDLIDALQDALRFTLVIASHDPDVVARFDRDVQLADGAVVPESVIAA